MAGPKKDHIRLRILYEGRVQGVGFRYTVVEIAQRYPVTGFVQNLSNGDVLLVAEGPGSGVRAFVQAVATSHLERFIRKVLTEPSDATGEYSSFGVRH